jgi:glycosyltransferase involved in cell wall biosynthesis
MNGENISIKIGTEDSTTTSVRPLRILHVLGDLTRGGIETWLMHLLRRTDRSRFQTDFFLRSMAQGQYDNEAESLGSRIGRSDRFLNPFHFEADLRAFVQQNGPYDIIHSHFAEFNGLIMWIAARCGIKIRIAHSHNDTRLIDRKARLHRRAYLALGKRLIQSYATHCVGADDGAAASQFGASWKSDPRVRILRCGIDLVPFTPEAGADKLELRRDLGFPDGAFVVGHVGRFAAQKNHAFLLRVVAQLSQTDPSVHLLLVGTGPMRNEIQSLIVQSGLASRVVLLEPRPDVPRLMLDAMDVFVLPSLHEGLPLVALEAQAAGLPCIVSEATPKNACVVPSGIEFLSLQLPAEEWADRIARYKSIARTRPQVSPLAGTPFDIAESAARLFEFYSAAHLESTPRQDCGCKGQGQQSKADHAQTELLNQLTGNVQHQ